MHKLNRISKPPKDFLGTVIAGKTGDRGVRLTSMLSAIEIRYETLEAAYSILGIAGVAKETWTKEQQEDLLHCYGSATHALERLKSLITQRQKESIRDFCSYCGIGAPRQFDHYLPKEKYPEFSVHAHNLIPCCGTCNGKKSDLWLDAAKNRLFLNLYLDSLPAAPMLKLNIKWLTKKGKRVPTVSFDLVRPSGFSLTKFRIVESHFNKLELLSRYKDQSHTEFSMLRDAAIARETKSVVTLKKFLQSFLAQRESTLGPLNWRIALYKSLIVDVPFLKECLKP